MLSACAIGSIAAIAAAVWFWGAIEVRGHPDEVLFITGAGVVWLRFLAAIFAWLGVSIRDDAIERRNPAALLVSCSAIIGLALIYAGGNIGEGPSYSNNFFSAGIATAAFFLSWLGLELATSVSRSIAEERDVACAVRFSGFLIASGLILARSVAGDWHSQWETLHDMLRDGWPAVVLCALEIIAERVWRSTPYHPFHNSLGFGLIPGTACIGLAMIWVWQLGRWEGIPR